MNRAVVRVGTYQRHASEQRNEMTENLAAETPTVSFRNAVHFTITGVSQTQYDEIVALILLTDHVIADESGVWRRRDKPPVFIATITSPRTLEGSQRNTLRAQIQKAVPGAHVTVW